jgi:hypothetical protein
MRWAILLVMLLVLAAVVLAVLSGNEDGGTGLSGALPESGKTNMAVWQDGGDMALHSRKALDNFCPFGLGLPKSLVSWAMPFDKLRANGMAQSFPGIQVDSRANGRV